MKPAKPHPERHDEGCGCRATRDRHHDPRRDAAQPEGGRTRTAWANDGSAHRGAPAGLRSLPTKAKRNKGSNSRAPANVASWGTAVATAETRAGSRGETEARAERADKRPDCGGGGRERPKGAADQQQHCDHREQCCCWASEPAPTAGGTPLSRGSYATEARAKRAARPLGGREATDAGAGREGKGRGPHPDHRSGAGAPARGRRRETKAQRAQPEMPTPARVTKRAHPRRAFGDDGRGETPNAREQPHPKRAGGRGQQPRSCLLTAGKGSNTAIADKKAEAGVYYTPADTALPDHREGVRRAQGAGWGAKRHAHARARLIRL